MNVHDRDIATPKVTTGPIAGSRKVHAVPEAAPDLRVPLREIVLTEAAAETTLIVPFFSTMRREQVRRVRNSLTTGLAGRKRSA